MGFEGFEPLFGEAKAQWSSPNSPPLRPFLFHVHALGPSCLRVHVTDFHSNTWEAVRSIEQLEDMRDITGIAGSWSEFIDYLIASIKSDDVKLILDGQPRRGGAADAKLITQKSKGMPLISISLAKLVDAAAVDAVANFSLELYKAFKNVQNLLVNVHEFRLIRAALCGINCQLSLIMSTEQKRYCQVMKVISADREKSETNQQQLDTVIYSKEQKSQRINDKASSDSLLVAGLQDSPDKGAAQNPCPTMVSKRVVPAHRRAKARGALLQDTEADGEK